MKRKTKGKLDCKELSTGLRINEHTLDALVTPGHYKIEPCDVTDNEGFPRDVPQGRLSATIRVSINNLRDDRIMNNPIWHTLTVFDSDGNSTIYLRKGIKKTDVLEWSDWEVNQDNIDLDFATPEGLVNKVGQIADEIELYAMQLSSMQATLATHNESIANNKTSITDEISRAKKSEGIMLVSGGYFYVSSSGVVSISGSALDVYYGIGGKFKRIPSGTELFTITGTGTNCVRYISDTNTFEYGDNKDYGIVVATCYGKLLYPMGDIPVKYETGDEIYSKRTASLQLKKANSVLENIINTVPTEIMNDAVQTYSRLVEWIAGDDVFLLAHITDVHSGTSDVYKHVGYLNELNSIFAFNVLCNTGDIGLDVGESDEEAMKLLCNTKIRMNCTSPWLFCKGNHERLVPLEKCGAIFNRASKVEFPEIIFGDKYGNYGYYDDEVYKVRTVFLNTSDVTTQAHYGMSKEQLLWLVSALNSVKDGWGVVILSHLCIDTIGIWNSSPGVLDVDWVACINSILEGYVTRASGNNTALGLEWNFTSSTGRLVCVLSGDSHFNNYICRNGVNYVVRQGYGSVSASDLPQGASYDTRGSKAIFDVLAIKGSGEAKIFRIGAGGVTRDLYFTY